MKRLIFTSLFLAAFCFGATPPQKAAKPIKLTTAQSLKLRDLQYKLSQVQLEYVKLTTAYKKSVNSLVAQYTALNKQLKAVVEQAIKQDHASTKKYTLNYATLEFDPTKKK